LDEAPPQQPPPSPAEEEPPWVRWKLAARERQKRPDLGSARHCAQVPGPLGPQAEPVVGWVWRLKGGSLMAPVAVTSIGAGRVRGTTSSSDGGGVCVCCWWSGTGMAVTVVVVALGRDVVIGVGTIEDSAQRQNEPSEQKPQESFISTEATGWSLRWDSMVKVMREDSCEVGPCVVCATFFC
jgi:hypothetical protein